MQGKKLAGRGGEVKLSNLMRRELIHLNLESTERTDAIIEMAGMFVQERIIRDKEVFIEEVFEREKLGGTGVGQGVAIPHARTEMVKDIIVAFGRSQRGINFESPDSKPVCLVFLIASPTEDNMLYLRTLSCLSRLLRERKLRRGLLLAESADEVLSLLSSFEEKFAPVSRNSFR